MPYGKLVISEDIYESGKPEIVHIYEDFIDRAIESPTITRGPHKEYEFYMNHPDFIEVEKPQETWYVLHFKIEHDGWNYTTILQKLSMWYDHKIRVVKMYR